MKGGRKPATLFLTKAEAFIPSRRQIAASGGLAAGIGPLLTGVGIKAGVGAGKGVAGEVNDELHEDGSLFDESQIGGDQSVADTRKNLDM
jgi:hypothetical protein